MPNKFIKKLFGDFLKRTAASEMARGGHIKYRFIYKYLLS